MLTFKLYDKSQTTPVESVAYEFNMLIALPGQDAPQNYKLTVRIMSRVAMLQRMKNNLPPPSFLRFFAGGAIVAEVDYVDYVVARNILTIVDSWAKETERPVKWKRAKRLQGISHHIPPLFHILFSTLTALALFAATKTIITPQSTSVELGQWLIVAFAAFIVGGQLAVQLARSVERSIDSIFELSAVCLNKGDERLLGEFENRNRWKVAGAIAGLLAYFLQGIAVNLISPVVQVWIE